MPEEPIATSTPDQPSTLGESPRWSPWRAFFTAGFCPKRTAMRTNHVGLARAFAVYCVAFLLTAMLVSMFDNWHGETSTAAFGRCMGQLGDDLTDLGRWFQDSPFLATAKVLGVFVGIGGALALAAIILSPWGARDEPVRASLTASLRRTWLHSPHALLVILLPGLVLGTIGKMQRDWWDSAGLNSPYPTPPVQPPGQPDGSPAWQKYNAAQQEYVTQHEAWNHAWDEAHANRPWLLRYFELIMRAVLLAAGIWAVWAWLRAIGSPRQFSPVDRPPLCEFCGYNLSHTPPDSRCPECGESVAASLGPAVRPGSPWERRAEFGLWRAWWRCWIDPLLRPRAFGRSLRVSPTTTAYRGLFAAHLLLIGVASAISAVLLFTANSYWDRFPQNPGFAYSYFVVMAEVTVGFALLVSFAAATSVGIWYRVTAKRNLLPVAVQAMAYSGSYLLLWTLVLFGTAIVTAALDSPLRAVSRAWTTNEHILQLVMWLLPQAMLAIGFLRRVFQITSAAKYANG